MIRFVTILIVLFLTMSTITIPQTPTKETPPKSLTFKDSIALKLVEIQTIDTINGLMDKKIELQENISKQSLQNIEKKVEHNQKEIKNIKNKNNKLLHQVNILKDSLYTLKNDSVLIDSVCVKTKGLFKNKCKTYKYIYK